ncbi:unnamed protein product [Arabis nemorensis]|uniref:Uncharacterized protein n=1 Tax=Arabis nemorensis TaxID=586526 RepID=A0A565C426_9BRAS|nr:unnamed protein product [Arabis nemorensis]
MFEQGVYSDQSICDEEDAYMENLCSESEEGYGRESDREELEHEPPDFIQYNSSQQKWYKEELEGRGEIIFK